MIASRRASFAVTDAAAWSIDSTREIIFQLIESLQKGLGTVQQLESEYRTAELAVNYLRRRLDSVQEVLESGVDGLTPITLSPSTDSRSPAEPSARHPSTESEILTHTLGSLERLREDIRSDFSLSEKSLAGHLSVIWLLVENVRESLRSLNLVGETKKPNARIRDVIESLVSILEREAHAGNSADLGKDARESLQKLLASVEKCVEIANEAIGHSPEGEGKTTQPDTSSKQGEAKTWVVETGPPHVTFVWEPEYVNEDDYADLFEAIGDLVRAHGGVGLEVLDEQKYDLTFEGVPQ